MKNYKLNLLAAVVVVGFCSFASQGALTVLEDFDLLTPGSIDMQHVINEYGFDVELWNNQANKGERVDSGWATVEESIGVSGSQCLKIVPRDVDGALDANFTSMYLGYANMITDQATIYLHYKASDANNIIMAFNDNLPGYPSDVQGDDIGEEDDYQGTANYTVHSSLVTLAANQDFYVRHDGSYQSIDLGLTADTWYEMWVQFDVSNKATRYYICELGGTPAAVTNPATGTEWFGWRDDSNTSVQNIKFFAGGQNQWAYDVYALVDNICIEQEFTTESIIVPQPHCYGSDLNGDMRVDIFDFLILKSNYGRVGMVEPCDGDIDDDGDVDIFDFLMMKAEWGALYEQ